jgi:K+ transporter
MFYNLAVIFNGFYVSLALTVTMLFIVITFTKERRDERKRA